jgi:hypothetical protein
MASDTGGLRVRLSFQEFLGDINEETERIK